MIRDTPGARALALVPRKLFEFGVRTRNSLYDRGVLRAARLPGPVVSVGNITLGGTGKTPIVAAIAGWLRDEGFAVAILTRGYGRRGNERIVVTGDSNETSAEVAGDEPMQLARAVPGVHVVVDANRAAAGAWAARELGANAFVLDDGFQHRRVIRDLDIVAVDATDPFGGGEMLPFGRLREPLAGLRRASAIVVTRADRLGDPNDLRRALERYLSADVPIVFASHAIVAFRTLTGDDASAKAPNALAGRRAGALAALGNPKVFIEDLEKLGICVASQSLHRDHHAYTQADLDEAVASARRSGADCLVTTEKDAVKLEALDPRGFDVFVARLAIRREAAAELRTLCLETAARVHEGGLNA